MLLQSPPLSLYVHIPWCVRKCPYCDFNSHQAPVGRPLPQRQYVAALLDDLEYDLAAIEDRELISIFIGGGTPSLFLPDLVEELLTGICRRVASAPNLEVTLEANPGTIERGRFADYRQAGITRVSLGVQSLAAAQLKNLGRIHSPRDVVLSVEELHASSLHFNLDLMYGLPGQTVAQAVADVSAAIALAPQHLSHYQLTLEPGTVFHHRPPGGLPDEDTLWEMQGQCQNLLADEGFSQYEVSAYAQPGHRCRHNLNYWMFGDYSGIGAGAHGKLTDVGQGEVRRTRRCKQPREYLGAATAAGRLESSQAVTVTELPFEFMLNAFRIHEGFTLSHFERTTGMPAETILKTLHLARDRGLVRYEPPDTWSPSELGWRFLNDLQALFLPQ